MLSRCNDDWHKQLQVKIVPDWACRNRYCFAECEAAADDCSTAFGWSKCGPCVHDKCCTETKACSDDVDCLLHAFCRMHCPDSECMAACDSAHWIGGGLDWVWNYCLNRSCPGCRFVPLPMKAICGGFTGMTGTCQACMDKSCCAEGEACGTNAACAGVHMCVEACGADASCKSKCMVMGAPEGVSLLETLSVCQSTNCASECK